MNKFIPKVEFSLAVNSQEGFFFSFIFDITNNNHPFNGLRAGKEVFFSFDIFYTSFTLIFFWEQNA